MIVFIYGTSAEAIKIAPLARRLSQKGIAYQQWLTMFHGDSLLESVNRLQLDSPDYVIENGNQGKTISSSSQTLRWLVAMFYWFFRNRKKLKQQLGQDSIIIVHGDTLTTVLGALFARFLGLPSAHIEAGLRSGNWRHPFPEELDRRITGHLATIHYVPSEEAVNNLSHKDNVIYTHGNTVLDSVLDVSTSTKKTSNKYGVCLLHRFEFLGNAQLVKETLRNLNDNSPIPLHIYLDDYSGSVLRQEINSLGSSKLLPKRKLPYDTFISVLKNSEFVFTDSGGIQAECALLGIPTLIHRKATEQLEGVGENISLSYWDQNAVRDFLKNYSQYKKPAANPPISPTQVILEDLDSRGYLRKN